MLATLKDVLKISVERRCATAAFNTPNLESLRAALSAAQELNAPVVIMHAQIHEQMGLVTLDEIGKIMLHMADLASVPVCVHLDHATCLDYLKRALETGFTSVMYDGSLLRDELNFENTLKAVSFARKFGASVEAEIGSLGSREGGEACGESLYTDPVLAQSFAAQTGIDALACAFGTAHGLYLKKPKLDFERLARISALVDIPLVMHGGSGICEADYKRAIKTGVRKINYYTYMAKAGAAAVAGMRDKTLFHDMALCAQEAMKEDAKRAIGLFGALGEGGSR